MRIVASTPTWVVSGVNSFTLNLLRGLQRDHDVELLIVRQGDPETVELPIPTDINVSELQWNRKKSLWLGRWEALQSNLESKDETIYIPNYDFENSAVVPALSNEVGVLGILHSDESYHYEHMQRCGPYWNAAIAVSDYLNSNVLKKSPELSDRAFKVCYGVPIRDESIISLRKRSEGGPLRILYSGRLNDDQKRISDLGSIALELNKRGVAFELCIVGNGPFEATLRNSLKNLTERGVVSFRGVLANDDVLTMYRDYDCFVLTSNYEGLPLSLLEAMSQGCVPVVTDIRSGIPDVVRHNVNGFAITVGDVSTFADHFQMLQLDLARLQKMSREARATIVNGPFNIDHVVDRYNEVFQFIRKNIRSGHYKRPIPHRPWSWTGNFVPPPSLQISPDAYYRLKWVSDKKDLQIASLKKRKSRISIWPFRKKF